MNDIFRLQVKCRSDRGFSHPQTANPAALRQKLLLAGRPVYGGICTCAVSRIRICRVDNCVGMHFGNIVSDDLERHYFLSRCRMFLLIEL